MRQLLYSYGHIAPKTAVAKIVTIFYAILGIPLTVLCWSNIGDAMANAFRFRLSNAFLKCNLLKLFYSKSYLGSHTGESAATSAPGSPATGGGGT